MTTGWLLVVMVMVSSQSVESQSTTDDDETCSDEGLLSEMQRDVALKKLLDNQQQLFQRLGKLQ